MVKISVLYPNGDDVRFDFAYYTEKHMPRTITLFSAHPSYRGVSVERGVGGGAPGAAPTYVAMCHFVFTSADAFMEAFAPNAAELQGDIPNYTNIAPIIQVSEILMQ
ncbi:MAG TPA: EthD family reductase [Telluria sp.]|nr:EthD family reductase [Telluria sp.]